jgi:hypothetical protein
VKRSETAEKSRTCGISRADAWTFASNGAKKATAKTSEERNARVVSCSSLTSAS